MLKKMMTMLLASVMVFSLCACGGISTEETETTATDAEETETSTEEENSTDSSLTLGTVANTLAEDEESLVATYADQFEQLTYTDSETGLSITYNLYLPEGYDESESYPMVVFIGDSSCAGDDATVSLTQGLGALVWATEEWQSQNPTIVAVPTYPETILDDHGSYTTTEYVELTKSYIDYMCEEYAVDTSRIYGTGQSMGCMTTLILASEYPDLYAACMFVDGQWDISTLEGLEDQTFVYFAAEDDTNAWNGAQEVMEMFDSDSVSYSYAQWDGTWSVDELSSAASELFTSDENQYFISWATGTIDASTASSSGMSMGAPSGDGSGEMTPPSDSEGM
ncbi:MAG: prolyl oligopeptidase family serine peptidase, partial [Lachnospiraceae bacterium]|nr:prolyl oligopeptidase family serine peptidase [Lachnospiraceae bacterium]